jgi:hypothetical protein
VCGFCDLFSCFVGCVLGVFGSGFRGWVFLFGGWMRYGIVRSQYSSVQSQFSFLFSAVLSKVQSQYSSQCITVVVAVQFSVHYSRGRRIIQYSTALSIVQHSSQFSVQDSSQHAMPIQYPAAVAGAWSEAWLRLIGWVFEI